MMKVKWFFLVCCLIGLSSIPSCAQAEEIPPAYKYNLSLCALFKNEVRYLREWIEYHRMIGVDHFYLYDNDSRDGSSAVLAPYIKSGLVTYVRWSDLIPDTSEENTPLWALSTQLPAYENAIKYLAVKDTKWIVLADVDEYLVPVESDTLRPLLEKYEDYPGILLSSDFFDASHIDVLPRRDLLIATIELTAAPEQNVRKSIEKTIFKPSCQTSFTWPPYRCEFKEHRYPIHLDKNEVRINKYVHRNKGVLHFRKIRQKVHVDSRALTELERKELLDEGFEIEDKERAIYRFEQELRKRMGLEVGWVW